MPRTYPGGRRRRERRRHLQRSITRLSAGLAAGFAMGVLRHNMGGIKLDQASAFLIRASAFVLLRGRHVSQSSLGWGGGLCSLRTLSGRTVCTVSLLKPSRSGTAAQVCKGAAMLPSIFFHLDMPVSSPNHQFLMERDTSTACQRSKAVLLYVGSLSSILRIKRDGRLSVCLFNA